MALPILVDYEIKMDQVLQDTEIELEDDPRLALIAEAVKTYSTYRPLEVPIRTTGDGTFTYDLPDDWEDGFSEIKSIEYPADEQVPVILDPLRYIIYRDDTGLHLRFLADTPGTTEEFILTYTIRHTVEVDEGTIPESDFDAVVNLAASLACSAIGRKYTQDAGGSTIAVGSEQWRSVIRYSEKAAELMNLFLKHMGIGKEVGPALAFGTMVGVSSWGSAR
jgi:hypothetical protein